MEEFVHYRELLGHFPGAYAGIVSSRAPLHIQKSLRKAAIDLWMRGWVLRSGDADSGETAMDQGAAKASEIFLPWARRLGRQVEHSEPPPEAFDIASTCHPMWDSLSSASQDTMAKIVQLILGADLKSPILFVLCWTEDGANGATIPTRIATGPAGQAIRVAAAHGIPVFNIGG